MSLNCSANYNSGAANTIARSVNSLKFLWYNNCWEIGATRGDDTAIQALVVAKNGNTYLAMNCNGISCFACPTSISRAYNASYGSLQVGGIVDSFSDNAVFRAWNAAASFAGGSGTDAWAFSGNNTDYAVYGANDLYLYSGGIRRLQFTGGGVACFKCTICTPKIAYNGYNGVTAHDLVGHFDNGSTNIATLSGENSYTRVVAHIEWVSNYALAGTNMTMGYTIVDTRRGNSNTIWVNCACTILAYGDSPSNPTFGWSGGVLSVSVPGSHGLSARFRITTYAATLTPNI
jgi:hypothetical protein